ncbi:sensor histidine kinase [Modestobacter sp. VKM Ac-2986]|uniref:sensor histidine kinase n=1 Tax=Modestobacter sp. VKM Ac-2986 TaxID=3004140 RepID=UPI0022AB66A8|nr:sensor histidine kinase [Modestobacter sp. VKM Ac-2986]MCZ2830325.1 sensor histidine kinase [Modestobacter sp. VKM Ac-2986]
MRSRSRAAAVPPWGSGSAPLSEHGWRTAVRVWHVAFAAMVGTALVRAVAVVDAEGGPRPLLVGALLALVVGWVVLGTPALTRRDPARATAYLALLVLVIGVVAWIESSLLFLMFLAYPQVWFVVPTVPGGVVWTVVLAAASTTGPFVAWARGDEPLWGPGQTLVGMVFSLAMGLWVHGLLAKSQERADLIEQLEATRAELAEAHHQQGALAERERMAREVHDTLAQGFTSIVVLAQTATAQLPGDPGAAAERVALIEEVARENLAEARAMVAASAPVALDSATLVEALQRLTERFGRETGLATRLDTAALGSLDQGLSRSQEIVLLRGAQEALTNVRRHASASAVVLRIGRVGDVVAVHVEDDGVGFDPAGSAGIGLAGLRDRAEEAGGAVDVASEPGRGTRVTVRVPVR